MDKNKPKSNSKYHAPKVYVELKVVAKAKDLATVVFDVCSRAPKQFRGDLVPRMRNISMEIVRNIGRANETYIDIKLVRDIESTLGALKVIEKQKLAVLEASGDFDVALKEDDFDKLRVFILKLAKAFKHEEKVGKRLEYAHEALNLCGELDFLLALAMANKAITVAQRERLAGLIEDVKSMIGAYIASNKKKYGYA